MDAQSKAMLDAILAKDKGELTDEDKAFLRARSSYLNQEQRHVYAEVLVDEPEPELPDEEATSVEAEAPKPRRSRRASAKDEE